MVSSFKKITVVAIICCMTISRAVVAGSDPFVEGASDFLIDRASDNAMYVFERNARKNPFIKVFFPNTCSYLSNASFRQLFLSKDLLHKNVNKDIENILKESLLLYAEDMNLLKELDADKIVEAVKKIDIKIDDKNIRTSIDNINQLINGIHVDDEIYIGGVRIKDYEGLAISTKSRKLKIIELLNDNSFIDVDECSSGYELDSDGISKDYGYLFAAIKELKNNLVGALNSSANKYGTDVANQAKKLAKEKLVEYLKKGRYESAIKLISSYSNNANISSHGLKIIRMIGYVEEIKKKINDEGEEITGGITNFEKVLEAEKQISSMFVLSNSEDRMKVVTESYCTWWCSKEELKEFKAKIGEKKDFIYSKSDVEYRNFRKIIILLAQLSDADTKQQVQELLKSATLPSVSFGEKRIPGEHKIFVSAYFGGTAQFGNSRGTDAALFVPVGVEYAYGCTNTSRFLSIPSFCPKGYTMGVMLGVFDFAVPVNLSLHSRDDDVGIEDVLQPGLYFSMGPRDYPLIFGFGVERGRVYDSDNSIGGEKEKDTRFLIFVAFDMPLFAL